MRHVGTAPESGGARKSPDWRRHHPGRHSILLRLHRLEKEAQVLRTIVQLGCADLPRRL